MTNYTAFTLVDITPTRETRTKNNNTLKYYQQQNQNTLIQTIGLRSQPIDVHTSVLMTQDVVDYGFGIQYKGLHTVWKFNFSIEHSNVFDYNRKKLYHLINDADGVAIITGIEETAEISSRCFETTNKKCINLIFKENKDLQY